MARTTTVLLWILFSAFAASAQDFDPASVRSGETLWITTDRVQRATLIAADQDTLTVTVGSDTRRIPLRDIARIRRRSNGVKLGTAIGAGAGVVGAVILSSLAYDDNDMVGPALLLIGAGAAGGAAVDALLGRYHVVYERRTAGLDAAPPDALSNAVTFFAMAGPGVTRFTDRRGDGSEVSTGVLFRLGGSPVSVGVQMVLPRDPVLQVNGGGPVVQAQLYANRRVRAFVHGGLIIADLGPWTQAGGGIEVRANRRVGLRLGVIDSFTHHQYALFDGRNFLDRSGILNRVTVQGGIVVR